MQRADCERGGEQSRCFDYSSCRRSYISSLIFSLTIHYLISNTYYRFICNSGFKDIDYEISMIIVRILGTRHGQVHDRSLNHLPTS